MEEPAERKLRKSKVYEYNAWKDLSGRTLNITLEQLAQMTPTVKQQIREGLSDTKPGWKIVEIDQAERGEDSEEEPDSRRSSAYATCQIEDRVFTAIIDTGAGGSLVSKNTLD